jgi:uracil-DNA glycosylase
VTTALAQLLREIRACRICEPYLPHGVRPVIHAGAHSKICIVAQAPGIRVHETGISFNDPSGDRLREWMGLDRDAFYDPSLVAFLPMGFCYPGTGRSGDLPPRPECAPTWRTRLMASMPNIALTLVIGQYAQAWHLPDTSTQSLTDTVKGWRDHWPALLPLPHPSPRNNIWLKRNPWFEADVVAVLRARVREVAGRS